MPIIAKEPDSTWQPCPEGLHQAVCVDVVDLGLQQTAWGEKHKVEIRWQVDVVNDTGKRFTVRKRYGLSLHKKATLRTDLECWRGRKFTDEELKGFDLERLIGVNCQLQIIHSITDDGKTFDNVQALVPASPKMAKISPQDYIRQKDREKVQGNAPVSEDQEDPVPF